MKGFYHRELGEKQRNARGNQPCFALCALWFFVFTLSNALAATHTVLPSGSLTIKQAIAKAKPNDTIIVKSGTYREGNIIIEKSLTLIGEGLPVLDGENKFEILTIHAQGVVISGFKIINTGIASITDIAGIKIIQSKNIKILNNQFENAFFGIHVSSSSNIWIENNTLQADAEAEHQIGNGIHLWKCDHITIIDNFIQGHRDGIYFEFVTNSLIERNHSEGNIRYGLHFMFSHNDEYRHNKFINNGAGVAVMYTKNVKMYDNLFDHNWGSSSYGLLLKDIRDSFVERNRFIENSVGIFMEGSSRINFSDNTFHRNGWAVKLQASCDDNTFMKNNFTANTFDMATNGSLVLNKIEHNYWDKYEGYDIKHDGIGDVPYRPVSMYAMVVERIPSAVMLWRSLFVHLMDRAEKVMPAITPENLKDCYPRMRPYRVLRSNSEEFFMIKYNQ